MHCGVVQSGLNKEGHISALNFIQLHWVVQKWCLLEYIDESMRIHTLVNFLFYTIY